MRGEQSMEKHVLSGIDGPIEVEEPKLKPGEQIVTGVEGPIIIKDQKAEGETEMRNESSFEKIDRKSPEIMEALSQAPIYKKQGQVEARRAVAGEKITTTLASGAKETDNTANEGDMIVKNPGGEEYIISEKKFLGRYESSGEGNIYTAKGFCRAITNPFGKPIEIMASWGSPQTGDEHCKIADTCDADGNVDGEPYLIEADAFATTYKQVEG